MGLHGRTVCTRSVVIVAEIPVDESGDFKKAAKVVRSFHSYIKHEYLNVHPRSEIPGEPLN